MLAIVTAIIPLHIQQVKYQESSIKFAPLSSVGPLSHRELFLDLWRVFLYLIQDQSSDFRRLVQPGPLSPHPHEHNALICRLPLPARCWIARPRNYPISSNSSISLPTTLRPVDQKSGSDASKLKGANNSLCPRVPPAPSIERYRSTKPVSASWYRA